MVQGHPEVDFQENKQKLIMVEGNVENKKTANTTKPRVLAKNEKQKKRKSAYCLKSFV